MSDPTTTPVLDEQFDQGAPPESGSPSGEGAAGANGTAGMAGGGTDGDLRRLAEVPMELSVEIGRTQITVGETLALRAGSVVTLDRLAGEPVDLLVNGTPIARGEVVVVDEQFGLRITQVVNGDPTAPTPTQAPEQDAPDSDETPEA
ncbi:MAG: flagellar motor switch protein FliN [Solirubrobacterales bacterium]